MPSRERGGVVGCKTECASVFTPKKITRNVPFFTPPEILRSNLAEVILRMIALGMGNISSFPFIDSPSPGNIRDGFALLKELGATKSEGRKVFLTGKGTAMSRLPLDPRISRMIIDAEKHGCMEEVTIIASALSIQDPRERPLEKEQEADRMHKTLYKSRLRLYNAPEYLEQVS